jgi:hypothetical protein
MISLKALIISRAFYLNQYLILKTMNLTGECFPQTLQERKEIKMLSEYFNILKMLASRCFKEIYLLPHL